MSIFPVGCKLHMDRDLVCLCHSALCQVPRTGWGTWECSIMLMGLMNWLLTLSMKCRRCEESPRESCWYTVSQGFGTGWGLGGDVSKKGMKFLQNRLSWKDMGKVGAMHIVLPDLDREEGCPLTPAGNFRWVLLSLGMERRVMLSRSETLLVWAKSNLHTLSFEKWSGQA